MSAPAAAGAKSSLPRPMNPLIPARLPGNPSGSAEGASSTTGPVPAGLSLRDVRGGVGVGDGTVYRKATVLPGLPLSGRPDGESAIPLGVGADGEKLTASPPPTASFFASRGLGEGMGKEPAGGVGGRYRNPVGKRHSSRQFEVEIEYDQLYALQRSSPAFAARAWACCHFAIAYPGMLSLFALVRCRSTLQKYSIDSTSRH